MNYLIPDKKFLVRKIINELEWNYSKGTIKCRGFFDKGDVIQIHLGCNTTIKRCSVESSEV
jgi:hypothetical protein